MKFISVLLVISVFLTFLYTVQSASNATNVTNLATVTSMNMSMMNSTATNFSKQMSLFPMTFLFNCLLNMFYF